MRKIVLFVLSLTVAVSVFASQTNYGNIEAKFVRNYDGDTITVNIQSYPPIVGKKISIRVNGIDTPEMRGKSPKEKQLARTAKKLVSSLLKNAETIELKNMKRGKYFRIVADVYYDGKSLNEVLLKNKLAVPYYGGTKTKDWSK
jgi:micrococcal nuclease